MAEVLRISFQDRLGQHGMNPFVPVDSLGYAKVDDRGAQGVGLLTAQIVRGHHVIQHLAQSGFGRNVQIRIKSHGDVMRFGLGTRKPQGHILSQLNFELPRQNRFHRGSVDFAVPLSGVSIPDGKKTSGIEDGQIKRAASHELLVVQIATMLVWNAARNSPARR